MSLSLYIDADACPVKDEALKVGLRHQCQIYIVSNSWQRGLAHPLIERIVVPPEPDAADKWIAERIVPPDICITNDIPLAAHCLEKGAQALRPNGDPFTEQSIGTALAMRDLMANLRESGEITGGPAGFKPRDRQRFINALERMVQKSKAL